MAGPAGRLRFESLMAVDPCLTVYIVHAMRSVESQGQPASMTGRTFGDHAVMALDLNGREIVIGFP